MVVGVLGSHVCRPHGVKGGVVGFRHGHDRLLSLDVHFWQYSAEFKIDLEYFSHNVSILSPLLSEHIN